MPAINFDNVSKRYRISQRGYRTLREDIYNLSSRLIRLQKGSEKDHIWALRDVSFKVDKGERLGIIGPNGSGKTTTLRLLSGITTPTEGSISVKGKIGVLIELSAGFHPELTGRENIYLNGAVLGMTRKEIRSKFDAIVDFAELSDFIDTPVKRYSSGMMVRLGFSVAVHVDFEVLLVDEVLSVGDLNFQRKCFERMLRFHSEDHAIVFVSHNMASILSVCSRVIWLDKGVIREEGDPSDVIANYTSEMSKLFGHKETPQQSVMRRGSGEVRFTSVDILDAEGNIRREFNSGDTIRIRAAFRTDRDIIKPNFRFCIREANSRTVITLADARTSGLPDVLPREGVIECIFENAPLRPNPYCLFLNIGDLQYDTKMSYDVWDEVTTTFVVIATKEDFTEGYRSGQSDMVKLPFRFELQPQSDGIE
jgi:lipopolysaccharide transport system ATP-binding protein